MRKFLCVGALIFVMSIAANAADDYSKFQVFGGFSWLHVDTMKVQGFKSNYLGWEGEAQYNVKNHLGITADIGGNYGRVIPDTDMSHAYTFIFGPTVSFRREHGTLFFHTLFGANTENIFGSSSSTSDTAFAMAWGGGYDAKVNDKLSIRLGKLEWLYTRHNFTNVGLADHQNNLRYSAGIVINFGSR